MKPSSRPLFERQRGQAAQHEDKAMSELGTLAYFEKQGGAAWRKLQRLRAAMDGSAHNSPAAADFGRAVMEADADPERFQLGAETEEGAARLAAMASPPSRINK
jgi:hypothetical protein